MLHGGSTKHEFLQPNKQQLTTRMSGLCSILLVILSVVMSIPIFVGTKLEPFVSFGNSSNFNDILICSDIRSREFR